MGLVRYKLFSTAHTIIPNHTKHRLEFPWSLQYQSTVLALISGRSVLRSAEHNSCPALSCLTLPSLILYYRALDSLNQYFTLSHFHEKHFF